MNFLKHLIKVFSTIVVSFFAVIFCFFLLAVLVGIFSYGQLETSSAAQYTTVYGDSQDSHKLLSVPINGIILGDHDEVDEFSAVFASNQITFGYEVKALLRRAAQDKDIKGIILEINSPGGTIYGTRAISDGVREYKWLTSKPVFAHIKGLAASGGYWVASSADVVVADYGSSIGSIGVIYGPFKYYDTVVSESEGAFYGEVVTQNGIETTYFTAGRSKDMGNPYRRMTKEEVAVVQQGVENEYDQFVKQVSGKRKISQNQVRSVIGALIYDNLKARELKLIDRTLSKDDTYEELSKKAGLKQNKFQIVSEKKKETFFESLYTSFKKLGPQQGPKASSICIAGKRILAYYGSIEELCR